MGPQTHDQLSQMLINDQMNAAPIGIFDSGYGGLTVFKEIEKKLPQYDYLYLGDNARVPYGSRSFETVYHYTWECVQQLFNMGCRLVVLACNTASAKALRTIQQHDLVNYKDFRKVLGIIRPTTEIIDQYTNTKQIGILATTGTVNSNSYPIEINKFFPNIMVHQEACPMWVPLVENNEINTDGAAYFVQKQLDHLLQQHPQIDCLVLACTHYPLLLPLITKFVPPHIRILSQGPIVAESLAHYLSRHPEVDALCSKHGGRNFYTTDNPVQFSEKASLFYGRSVFTEQLTLPFTPQA